MKTRWLLMSVLLLLSCGLFSLQGAENNNNKANKEDQSYAARVRTLAELFGRVEDDGALEKRQQLIMELAFLLREAEHLNKDKKVAPFGMFIEPRMRAGDLHIRYDAVDVVKRAPQMFDAEPAVFDSLARVLINLNDSEQGAVELGSETRLEESYDQRALSSEALVALYKHVYPPQTDRYKEELFSKTRRDIMRILHREALTVSVRIWLQRNDEKNFVKLECANVLNIMGKQLKDQPADFWEKWWKVAQHELDADEFFRSQLIRLLGETNNPDSFPVLQLIWEHEPSPFPRKTALAVMARIAPEKAAPFLASAVVDPDPSISIEALRLLAGLLHSDSGWRVSPEVRQALHKYVLVKHTLTDEQLQLLRTGQKVEGVSESNRFVVLEGEYTKEMFPVGISNENKKKMIDQIEDGKNPPIEISPEQLQELKKALQNSELKKNLYKVLDANNQDIRAISLNFLRVWKIEKDDEMIALIRKRLETPHTTPDNPLVIRGEQNAEARFEAVETAEAYGLKELLPDLLTCVEREKEMRIRNRAAIATQRLGAGMQAAKFIVPQLLDPDARSWIIKSAAYTLATMSGQMIGLPDAKNAENYSDLLSNTTLEKRREIAALWTEWLILNDK